jgi:hypothetical protein
MLFKISMRSKVNALNLPKVDAFKSYHFQFGVDILTISQLSLRYDAHL